MSLWINRKALSSAFVLGFFSVVTSANPAAALSADGYQGGVAFWPGNCPGGAGSYCFEAKLDGIDKVKAACKALGGTTGQFTFGKDRKIWIPAPPPIAPFGSCTVKCSAPCVNAQGKEIGAAGALPDAGAYDPSNGLDPDVSYSNDETLLEEIIIDEMQDDAQLDY